MRALFSVREHKTFIFLNYYFPLLLRKIGIRQQIKIMNKMGVPEENQCKLETKY